MIWILERDGFPTGAETFEAAALAAGGEVRWLSPEDEARGRYGRWEAGEAVVFRGSFEAAEAFRRARPEAWPGVIGDEAALRCSAYYPLVGDRLLNAEYALVPLGDLRRLWDALRAMFGGEGLFVRPDSGAKAFTGGLVTDLDRFEARERPYLAAMRSSDLCVVARPRAIEAEYRTVVVDRAVVAGSRYKLEGKSDVDPAVPEAVGAFARTAAESIDAPAPAYMLDVAHEKDGRLSVVELNSFACSALYGCDPVPIVEAVRDTIVRYAEGV